MVNNVRTLLYNRTVIRFDTVKCNKNLKVDAPQGNRTVS